MGTGSQDVTRAIQDNVRQLRRKLDLSQNDLAERLAGLGHPLDRAGVAKIETHRREVSVRDLFALAMALDVSPARLAFPPDAESIVGLTPTVAVPAYVARRWMRGRVPLPEQDGEHFVSEVADEDAFMQRDPHLLALWDGVEREALHALGVKRMSGNERRVVSEVIEHTSWAASTSRDGTDGDEPGATPTEAAEGGA
jgi:transcriptional regulator with XRE-family HTH domain